jgi:sugar/nucleoside kinase (ribokinase family)
MRWDVLGLGCVAVDDLLYVAQYPAADSKERVRRRERSCGGLTATALVAGARFGASCAFAGVLGDNDDSRFVLDCFRREGIDVAPLVHRPEARPIHSTIIVDETQHTRTILFDLAGSTGASPDAPPAELIQSTRVLLIDHYGIEGMTRATRIAREAGVAVVADFERDEWPGFHQLLALVDHVIVSRKFAQHLTRTTTPFDAVDRLWSQERQLVAVTCGAEGCWYREASNPTAVVHQPAFAVEVVDTTGCGDVFHGVYAAALAQGKLAQERIRLASASAALKAARGGGHAGIPSRSEIEEFLAGVR